MAYLMDDFYDEVMTKYREVLDLPEEQKKLLLDKVREKMLAKKGYQRIIRDYPGFEYEQKQEEPGIDVLPLQIKVSGPKHTKEEQLDHDEVCFSQEEDERQPEVQVKVNEEGEQKPKVPEEDWRPPSPSSSSCEQHFQEQMEKRVEMGICGSLISITRTKNRTIALKMTDVVVKNRTGEYLLSKLTGKFDLNLTNNIHSLD